MRHVALLTTAMLALAIPSAAVAQRAVPSGRTLSSGWEMRVEPAGSQKRWAPQTRQKPRRALGVAEYQARKSSPDTERPPRWVCVAAMKWPDWRRQVLQ